MKNKNKKIKLNSKNYIAFIFVILISSICVGMFFNARIIGSAILKGYKDYLPSNYNNFDIIKASIKSTEKGVNDSVVNRNSFINLNGLIHKLNGSKIVDDVDLMNTVYKMDNGQLTFNYPNDNMDLKLENLKQLHAKLTRKDIKMLYIQAPFKLNKYEDNLPWGIEDTTNINTDIMIDCLKKNNIPFLDLRNSILKDKLVHSDLFYNTDHHWKIETALWANKQVLLELNQRFGMNNNLNTVEINKFHSIEIKNSFLGAQGRRVGKYYGGVDDFTYLIPKFDTSYHVEFYNSKGEKDLEKDGSFKETIIIDKLVQEDSSIETNRYAVYFGGDWPLVKIINSDVNSGNVLILQDSFGLPFSAFMSLNFRNTDIIDLRHFKEKSLNDYLEENEYELVLFLYNPSAYREENTKQLFKFD